MYILFHHSGGTILTNVLRMLYVLKCLSIPK